MKKFNVPTQLDCILQLITSDKRKPHLFKLHGKYVADIERAKGRFIRATYNPDGGLIVVSLPPISQVGPQQHTLLIGWDEVYFWAKRVDGNRWKWDK